MEDVLQSYPHVTHKRLKDVTHCHLLARQRRPEGTPIRAYVADPHSSDWSCRLSSEHHSGTERDLPPCLTRLASKSYRTAHTLEQRQLAAPSGPAVPGPVPRPLAVVLTLNHAPAPRRTTHAWCELGRNLLEFDIAAPGGHLTAHMHGSQHVAAFIPPHHEQRPKRDQAVPHPQAALRGPSSGEAVDPSLGASSKRRLSIAVGADLLLDLTLPPPLHPSVLSSTATQHTDSAENSARVERDITARAPNGHLTMPGRSTGVVSPRRLSVSHPWLYCDYAFIPLHREYGAIRHAIRHMSCMQYDTT
ncbi:hypothetical protein D9619_010024 [Psilocybe cf. subviscida]|uniref:Uncharacterized protein n=1 Tax=Psilocybe cf. subviscida TaxID=2480587 RepID=A0A8H5F6B7_9AGAR|nr:hypothetical protein D9619_010024 [Psilocybe cf. subviscida]